MNHKSNPKKYFPRLWVGVTGEIAKNKWMFDSNMTTRAQEANFDEMIFDWQQGQPNNHEATCIIVMHTYAGLELNDVSCKYQEHPVHGLCEFKVGWYNEK